MREKLKKIKLFILDMDGTVYLGDNLIKGSDIFIKKAKEEGKRVIFFTNNASRTAEFYKNKLDRLGIPTDLKDIVTSGDVTIEFLKTYYPDAKVYLNGTTLLKNSFLDNGINLTEEEPDIVIQSFDLEMNYDKMVKITDFIRDGIPFIATHCDINCPTETGFIPDCGAMCALIESSTGVKPRYLGKPEKETLEMILKITGTPKEEAAFVGDRIYTDVACGVLNGANGILVLSGESDMNTVKTSSVKPTMIFKSLGEIAEYL